jgi:dTDP-4-dehydrorhamnose reductase
MEHERILLTGASGELGQNIVKSGYFKSLLTPARKDLDITEPDTIENFFEKNSFDAIIHCAAMARMMECEQNPEQAILTNITGTSNIVFSTILKEKKENKKIRFMQISTDGVYPGIRGNYSEKDETIPYNKYGWTKLGAECPIKTLSNYCIIRTSFFDPDHIKFDDAAIDAYSSKAPIKFLVEAIKVLLNKDFVGTVNVGREKRSDYEHYKEFKPDIKRCKIEDLQKKLSFKMYKDSSMNLILWNKLKGTMGSSIKGRE